MTEGRITAGSEAASSQPLVSIIAPCYNAEKYLEAALQSIFAQDYGNFEVIIVDDGSTDNSLAMLRALQQTYDFQLYTQPNQGVSATLNNGLAHANGVYVSTPDLDDIMLPHSISTRARYLDEHPKVGCVGALIAYMDSDGVEIKTQHRTQVKKFSFDEIVRDAVVMGAPGALYRMEAMKAAGFYDPAIKVQDFQMTLRIASKGYEIHELPVVVTRYRRHPNNLSRRFKVLLDADLQAMAPFQDHPGYEKGRSVLIHKALKYAVVSDKKYAWGLLRSIPLRHFNRTTFKRLKRLVLHR
ncbi:glycosyltransferase family 2 protein [Pseudomonas sp. P66]|uniref:Glycosyltransferase family 2 protein n=1 Tax=Pseudomonas arcuscaelestis TaxID=2710591 RepID=A0ABS2C3M9_9PSED|nr:glycosyltransferase family 2 protein [Pseudomonas arcuscaelestis]MBM5459831.1 glycosyltransferase family 2 protein [Pseudomonas arcuscaelestis]